MRIVITDVPNQAPMVFEHVGAMFVAAIPLVTMEPQAFHHVPAFILGTQHERDRLAISALATVLDATPFEHRVSRANYIYAQALEAAVTDKGKEMATETPR